jgi:hypothetical protein
MKITKDYTKYNIGILDICFPLKLARTHSKKLALQEKK